MPVFHYKAYDADGKIRKGTIDEDSRRAALERLKQLRLVPIEVSGGTVTRAKPGTPRGGATAAAPGLWARLNAPRVSLRDVAAFTRQLSTLLGAGLPLVEALTATLEQAEANRIHDVVADVRDRVNEGASLAESLHRHPSTFNDLYVNMVAAGEQSGTLEIVLERLADFLDGQIELRNQITGMLAYPAIMFFAMLGVVGILFVFVIPKITQVFEQTGQELPLPTQILITTTTFVRLHGIWVVVGVVALIWLFRRWKRSPKGRARWDRFKLALPVFGLLERNVALSRFARTLSTLLSSGVSLPVSLRIVKAVVGNTIYADAVEQVNDAVVEGGGLSMPLRKTGVFPAAMVRMVAAGEQSGELEDMLARVAQAYDREVAMRLTIVTRMLEPILIVLMGGLVFFIMLSILVPMFRINQLVG